MKKAANLSFKLFDTSHLPCRSSLELDKVYSFWKESWEKTFVSLKVYDKESLGGDGFLGTRVLSLWDGDEPVALIFLDTFDLSCNVYRETGYIQTFPREALRRLIDNNLMVVYSISNMVVRPDWRKSQTDVPLAQVLTSLGFQIAKNEKADVVLTLVRNERKVNQIFLDHGAMKMGSGFLYNCDVDFQYIPLDMATIYPTPALEKVCGAMLKRESGGGLLGTTQLMGSEGVFHDNRSN